MSAPHQSLFMLQQAADPYFSSVVMLGHFDGANGATTPFANSCPRGNAPTGVGTVSLSNVQKLYGPTSVLLGNTTSAVSNASHADYAFGSGDFTIEFWCYGPNTGVRVFLDMRPVGTDGAYPLIYMNGATVRYFVSSADRITSGNVLLANTSQRIAVSRVSGTTRMYHNGTQVGSNYTDSTTYLQGQMLWGLNQSVANANGWGSYFDEIRVTKGVGRYSGASYTLATAPFPNA